MSRITRASARLVYDSRGKPTVEVELRTDEGGTGTCAAPSGASTGTHEVAAFPAGGVPEALSTFARVVGPALIAVELSGSSRVDAALHEADGTPNFARIGGNVATATSIAAARAIASDTDAELWEVFRRPHVDGGRFPAIVGNCLNGGRHAIGGPEIQEFIAFSPEARPEDSIRVALSVHSHLGAALHERFPTYALGRGDEGGWVAPLGNLDAVAVLAEACRSASEELHLGVYPGLDLAASEFYADGEYPYREQKVDAEGQVAFLADLVDKYGIRYLEDPFDQEDFGSFAELTKSVGSKCLIVGDDLYTTSLGRFQEGIRQKSSNAILIKVNQVGTLTDTMATVDAAHAAGIRCVASHRSGDLPDGWLAHLAVGIDAVGLKCGLLGGERVAKLNELLRLGARHREPIG